MSATSATAAAAAAAAVTTTAKNEDEILVHGFQDLQWYCAPDSWGPFQDDDDDDDTNDNDNNNNDKREGRDGSWLIDQDMNRLTIYPPAKKDYWRKTYYRPIMIKDDGPFLHNDPMESILDTSGYYTVTTVFDLTATRQFDQAGIMVRIDAEHWLKTGIEVVDGKARLSCVVTNHGYSDWSTQPWYGPTVTTNGDNRTGTALHVQKVPIRVHWRAGSVVVESKLSDKGIMNTSWDFIRIAHLEINDATAFQAGVFACTPVDQQGGHAIFYDVTIQRGSHVEHNADDV